MTSVSLLERGHFDGTGQRNGHGFNPSQPISGLRRAPMFRKTQQIHLVGIGGAGMSGIAEVLLTLGYKVTGSDLQASDTTRRLEELGGRIFIGHEESNVGDAQVVVISSAVSPVNPEVIFAKAKQVPVIPRAEMLAELMRLKFGVAIAGAHGKTTTTSMVANVLAQGGLDPTMVIGGKVNALGSHARLGRGDLLVAEADESDGSFLRLSPTVVAVTNLDREHLDHYGSMERINESFLEFINKVPFYGLAVLCADDDRLRALFPKIVKRYQTYGLREIDGISPDFRATDISLKQWGAEFRAFYRGRNLGPFRLSIPGIHNVSNALAAIAIGIELDVPTDLIRKALAAFTGVERRFHLRGEAGGIMVVDDYGHHPTEIKATLAAAKQGWTDRRLIVLFQPHRYTRTRDLLEDFSRAFTDADRVFLTDIYAASEQPIPGVSGARLAEAIRATGHQSVTFVERKEDLVDQVFPEIKPGDLVLTLGAGDIWKSGPALLARLAPGT
ncbi:UDP-N-acetylmuramate:L-alanine ligase [Nitrospira japonica]|uniref:UDP-N-acetylmuramate--L-alanine ligase n=2 Tax=Nitrospira japonica TaxID=1325564 RepID=A0A1W1I4H4_9BACT|nr:UDP-N-acetylmuramate--L-alanine ligase [Nitrospira japonica]SLM47906.1 UDP-N-acetylmuramate:L-alanine ligase [Nitrospira japonica]